MDVDGCEVKDGDRHGSWMNKGQDGLLGLREVKQTTLNDVAKIMQSKSREALLM